MAKKTDEEKWRDMLTRHHHAYLSWLPHDPRCAVCGVPFAGFGGTLAKLAGYRQWNKNPTLCNLCYRSAPSGGIETDIAVMFADFRGSTSMAERLEPSAFAAILNRFYRIAIEVLAPHRAIIDKMIGDEVMAFFTPMGSFGHRSAAVSAAVDLMRRFPEVLPEEDVPRLGIGVAAGNAFVGKVGDSTVNDFTALGDTVNSAARLQASALAGEIVVSDELYGPFAEEFPNADSKTLSLRGREEPMSVRVLRPLTP